MTLDVQSIDPNLLRSQLFAYRRLLDDEVELQSRVDILRELTDEELLSIWFIHQKGKAKAKEVEEYIHCSRSTALKYCKHLVYKGITRQEESDSENTNLNATFFFCVADEKINEILSAIQANEWKSFDIDTQSSPIHGTDENDSIDASNRTCSSNDIASIAHRISQLPPIAKQILELIKNSSITAKETSETIKCASTTANKYLKQFVDDRWANRNKNDNGKFVYCLTEELSNILDTRPVQAQQRISEEFFMESINTSESSTHQSNNFSIASRLKQWINLNHQIKEIEKELIAREGSDAEELLADLRKKAL